MSTSSSDWRKTMNTENQKDETVARSSTKSTASIIFRITAFGEGLIWRGNEPVYLQISDCKYLLFYLIHHEKATAAELYQLLERSNRFDSRSDHYILTLVRYINRMVDAQLIYVSKGRYRINSGCKLIYDVKLFKELVGKSMLNGTQSALAHLEKAVQLQRLPFLTDCTLEWASQLRADLLQEKVNILYRLASIYYHQSMDEVAIEFENLAIKIQKELREID